jgi:hypothetical protein
MKQNQSQQRLKIRKFVDGEICVVVWFRLESGTFFQYSFGLVFLPKLALPLGKTVVVFD